jgi:23S rRNA (uracil1939-C5)-methyltransferase
VSRRERRRLDLVVTALGDEMRGIASAEGREVHVRAALPGERVTAEVVRRHRGRWYARVLEWHERSPQRTRPACPVFDACGGCAAQHVATNAQLAWKQAWLLRRLEAAQLAPARVRPPVTGPQYHYRRKARLGVRHLAASDEVVVGFREAFTRKVTRMDACDVLVPPFASLIRPLRTLINGLDVRGAVPQIEVAAGDDRAVVVLRHLEPFTGADRRMLQHFAQCHAVDLLVQAQGYDSIVGLDGGPPPALQYRLDRFGIALAFGPADFVQVNATVNARLVEGAVEALALRRADRILDLFCGIGNFTLPIARTGAVVTGVEANPALVSRARHNAHRNGLDARADYWMADLYQPASVPELAADTGSASNKVLLDPPRSGAGPALALLRRPHVERVVYVSCHPDSFVHDAAALVAAGYEFSEVGIFDMFPQTAHVEMLGVFCRR